MQKNITEKPELIPAQRRARLLDAVREGGAASIHDLVNLLNSSLSTVRRDLDQLTKDGYLERTHGGVLLRRSEPATFEAETVLNAHRSLRQKQAIGLVAAQRMSPGFSVFCDSSTTVLEAVRVIIGLRIRLTIVTNNLMIASLCAPSPDLRIIMPGGTIRAGTMSLVGPPGEPFLETLRADLCLLGTHSITGTLLTESSMEAAVAKKIMIRNSRRVILLADSSKFQLPSFCEFCNIDVIDELITDDGVSPDHLHNLEGSDLKVTIVPVGTRPL